jgi:uncharacterized membrane protein
MDELIKFLHLASAIVWLGGMVFVLAALRPAMAALLEPPARLALLARVLARFFALVWLSIGLLLATGVYMLAGVGMRAAPAGWHLMLGIGLLMCIVFAHIYFAPFKRLQVAVAAGTWPEGGRQAALLAKLVMVNFCLGWLAIAAVRFVR